MMTLAEYRALLRGDFMSFTHRCFLEVNPQAKFLMNWHLEVIAEKLRAVREGRTKRLIINLPPRHLKSIMASVAFPAWCLGHNPGLQIIGVSYAQELANKLSRDCRAVMNAPWYRALFGTRLSGKQAVNEFETTRGGFRLATSIGGVLTGRGADIIIVDDPLKPDEAVSVTQRRNVNEFYGGTLYSRLNSKEHGAIVIIMQRLHEDDLVGHVLEKEEGWEVVRFPAIAEVDETFVTNTLIGQRRFVRKAGEALHPERESLDTLDVLRRTIGAYNFAGQYQQSPAPLGGGLVKREWFRFYDPTRCPASSFARRVQSWDTANTPGELSDYSVCTTWGIRDRELFLLDVFRQRLDYPALKHAVMAQARRHHATTILIEDRASGTQLIQELRQSRIAVKGIQPQGDKVMRMNAQTAAMESGLVHLPEGASWLDDYLLELTTFPRSKHDDQADSTSQFLAWFAMGSSRPRAFSMPMGGR